MTNGIGISLNSLPVDQIRVFGKQDGCSGIPQCVVSRNHFLRCHDAADGRRSRYQATHVGYRHRRTVEPLTGGDGIDHVDAVAFVCAGIAESAGVYYPLYERHLEGAPFPELSFPEFLGGVQRMIDQLA